MLDSVSIYHNCNGRDSGKVLMSCSYLQFKAQEFEWIQWHSWHFLSHFIVLFCAWQLLQYLGGKWARLRKARWPHFFSFVHRRKYPQRETQLSGSIKPRGNRFPGNFWAASWAELILLSHVQVSMFLGGFAFYLFFFLVVLCIGNMQWELLVILDKKKKSTNPVNRARISSLF